ncbi:MAG: hypothetical protein M5U34_29175 [Chloroflexi bacterium]|nr:hypothetical protein [Chloroflexota bacterium]
MATRLGVVQNITVDHGHAAQSRRIFNVRSDDNIDFLHSFLL